MGSLVHTMRPLLLARLASQIQYTGCLEAALEDSVHIPGPYRPSDRPSASALFLSNNAAFLWNHP